MKKYRAETLISGADVDAKFKGMTLVATPNGTDHTQMITFAHEYMIIPKKTKPLSVRTFNDKFGRDRQYRLFYHKWVPKIPKAVREVHIFEAPVNDAERESKRRILEEARKTLSFLHK